MGTATSFGNTFRNGMFQRRGTRISAFAIGFRYAIRKFLNKILIYSKASARLLRKADQTRAILSVCHVMWSSKVKQNDGSIKLLKDDKKVVNFIGKVCHHFLTTISSWQTTFRLSKRQTNVSNLSWKFNFTWRFLKKFTISNATDLVLSYWNHIKIL